MRRLGSGLRPARPPESAGGGGGSRGDGSTQRDGSLEALLKGAGSDWVGGRAPMAERARRTAGPRALSARLLPSPVARRWHLSTTPPRIAPSGSSIPSPASSSLSRPLSLLPRSESLSQSLVGLLPSGLSPTSSSDGSITGLVATAAVSRLRVWCREAARRRRGPLLLLLLVLLQVGGGRGAMRAPQAAGGWHAGRPKAKASGSGSSSLAAATGCPPWHMMSPGTCPRRYLRGQVRCMLWQEGIQHFYYPRTWCMPGCFDRGKQQRQQRRQQHHQQLELGPLGGAFQSCQCVPR